SPVSLRTGISNRIYLAVTIRSVFNIDARDAPDKLSHPAKMHNRTMTLWILPIKLRSVTFSLVSASNSSGQK
ncbi:MAG TPA: hypothetical protein VM260_09930, partial [Pirellula sp.]|nr:hypothetical protein [Pirellula sp.]